MPKRTIKTPAKATKAQAAKPAAKPSVDKAAERLALTKRIADERASGNSFFAAYDPASKSVPVKTLSAFKRSYKADVTAHAIGRKPSVRQAAAIVAAFVGNNVKLADGATASRKFEYKNAPYAIENGALSDAIASGLCTYDAATESVTIASVAELRSQLGSAFPKA